MKYDATRFIPTYVGSTRVKRYTSSTAAGSSPRMWGLRHRTCPEPSGFQRFIPTYVGSTKYCTFSSMCLFGSSPRMWGLLPILKMYTLSCRFIPTYVGSTSGMQKTFNSGQRFIPTYVGSTKYCTFSSMCLFGSSPRMWGLLSLSSEVSAPSNGSSPRMWGLPYIARSYSADPFGSSPRMWGLRLSEFRRHKHWPVHPHVCGVYARLFLNSSVLPTVHPHVCGVYCGNRSLFPGERRFIPTYVGSTPAARATSGRNCGSSPRMWGLLFPCCKKNPGITVHPHVCGVYEA